MRAALAVTLLNYPALKYKPMSWRIAGSVGVAIWTIRNIDVHARSEALGRIDMAAVAIIAIPAIPLPGLVRLARPLNGNR